MSLLDNEEVLFKMADAAAIDFAIQQETERFLALGLFRRGQVSAVVYEDKEELLLKKLSEAWKLNLDYKTSLAQRLHGIVVNAVNEGLKEHHTRDIYSIDCRYLRKGDAYGWLSAVSKASKDPILVIEHLTEVPNGDRSIYDDPAYVTNLLLRSWKNGDIYAGDLEIDRRQFTVILACRDIDAQEFERECALCSYAWCGDFDSYLEKWKKIATENITVFKD
jgi:hypothetical protein